MSLNCFLGLCVFVLLTLDCLPYIEMMYFFVFLSADDILVVSPLFRGAPVVFLPS